MVQPAATAATWKSITEAGGIDKWVTTELAARGVLVDASERGKDSYKDRKKAEAAERRKLRRAAWEAYRLAHVVHLGAGVHWEDRVDPDRFDVAEREERAKALGLPEWKGADELASALGLTVGKLRWLTFQRSVDTGTHYVRWTIPKRDGSRRVITAPKRLLKAAQRYALRKVFERLPVHGAAHGFVAGRSIASNAAVHAGAATIVAVDIKDFFPTVTWKRVKGLLRKHGVAEPIAVLLALAATESPREEMEHDGKKVWVAVGERALPQGAPTSPAITNAICLRMDKRMAGLARRFGFRYTRYADDLTFSWHTAGKRAPVGALLHGVHAILRAEGFEIHPSKTRVLRPGARQKVTGLIVNQAPPGAAAPPARVPRDVQRRLRAAIHNLKKGKPLPEGETLARLKGLAAFVFMTDPARGKKWLDELAKLGA
jgi:hypothetical protein